MFNLILGLALLAFTSPAFGQTWVQRPGTDHWYTEEIDSKTWDLHQANAEALGGNLVIIEDQTEMDWLASQWTSFSSCWIGLYQDVNDPLYSEPGGGWKWSNGQPLSYSNWASIEPNNGNDMSSSGQEYAVMFGSDGEWADAPNNSQNSGFYEMQSTDCDGNLIPDVLEIALDPSLDSNSDGILDSCGGGGPFSWEEDCNGNGVLDLLEISSGSSTDWNSDGRPDECTTFTSILRTHEGSTDNSAFTMHITGDLDGDSVDDYLTAEPYFDLPSTPNTGRVRLRSGADGSVLHEWVTNDNPAYTDLNLGFALDAGGDWDADGTNDILIGAPGYSGTQTGGILNENGAAFIYSGVAPYPLLSVIYGVQNGQRLGYSVCFIGDTVGADGKSEYAVSSPFATVLFGGLGQVTIYQGGSTTILDNYSGNPGDLYGAKIASGADLNGDGISDLLIGAPGDDTQGPGTLQDGRVIIVSGTGSVIAEIEPVANWSSFTGAALTMIDDLNGDGRTEFAVGSPRFDLLNGQGERAGKVTVYEFIPNPTDVNGAGTASALFDIKGAEPVDNLGISLARVGDVNGDGISEFAVGAPGARAVMQPAGFAEDVGKVLVVDAVNQRVVRELSGGGIGDRFGYVLAGGTGDLDGDGGPDLIAGSRAASGDAPYAWITSDLQTILGSYYCEPNEEHDADDDGVLETGLRALISASGTTDLSAPGGSLTLRCDYMPTNQFGIFYHGTNAIQTPFGPVGGWRCVGGGVSRLPILNSGSDGQMTLEIDYAGTTVGFNPAALAGQTRHFQCWFRDAPGQSGHFNLSDAVSLTFQ